MNDMNDRELVSALMDGELEGREQEHALELLAHDPALAETWRRWQLMRSSLRHEAGDARDLSAAVAARLDAEPALLAPQNFRVAMGATTRTPRQRSLVYTGAALAASLVLGLVLWLGRTQELPAAPDFGELYAAAPQQTVITDADAVAAVDGLDEAQRENAYIVTHAEYAHRGLQTGLRNFTRLAMADTAVPDTENPAGEGL